MNEHICIISKSFGVLSYICAIHTHTHTHRYKSKCDALYTYLSNLVTILNLKKKFYLFIWLPWALFAALGIFTVAGGIFF